MFSGLFLKIGCTTWHVIVAFSVLGLESAKISPAVNERQVTNSNLSLCIGLQFTDNDCTFDMKFILPRIPVYIKIYFIYLLIYNKITNYIRAEQLRP